MGMGFRSDALHVNYAVTLDSGPFTVNMAALTETRKVAVQYGPVDILKGLGLTQVFDQVWFLTKNEGFAIEVSKGKLTFGYDSLVDEYVELAKKFRQLEQNWNLLGKNKNPRKQEMLWIRCSRATEEAFKKFAVESHLDYDKAVEVLVAAAKDKDAVELYALQAKIMRKTDLAVVPFKET